MWWVMFPLKKHTLLVHAEHKCPVNPKKCGDEGEEHQQAADGDVVQRVLGLLQPPLSSCAKDTSAMTQKETG